MTNVDKNSISSSFSFYKNPLTFLDNSGLGPEPNLNLSIIQKVPIDQLEKYLESVDKNKKIILLCQYGNKSQLAANYILKMGFNYVSHLQRGIESLEQTKLSQS